MKSPADSLIVQRLEVDPPVLSESGSLSPQHVDSFVRDLKLNFTLTALILTLRNCVHFLLFLAVGFEDNVLHSHRLLQRKRSGSKLKAIAREIE